MEAKARVLAESGNFMNATGKYGNMNNECVLGEMGWGKIVSIPIHAGIYATAQA
jgi:hypothetical protein